MSAAAAGMVHSAAPLVVAATLVVSGLVLASARSPVTAMAVLLAAGLLHLSADRPRAPSAPPHSSSRSARSQDRAWRPVRAGVRPPRSEGSSS